MIELEEESFRRKEDGRQVRPFSQRAGVSNRAYSLPLQRALADFGADVPFAQVPQKMREHYGIEVSASAAREITERHGELMRQHQEDHLIDRLGPEPGWEWMVSEADGCLIPVVKFGLGEQAISEQKEPATVDRRKTKELCWREARLCLAHEPGQIEPRYAATLGDVEAVGDRWLDCVARAGAGAATLIHSLGDGAAWIADQAERCFGEQGSYLLDFYHVSEYLNAAGKQIAPLDAASWRKEQQGRLKENRLEDVLAELTRHWEPVGTREEDAPVLACHRYLNNHREHLNYKGAIEHGLPIGSGEIESGHRHVIQARLKRPGAWWKEENAEKMLALRVARANQEWDSYWQGQRQGTS